MRTATRTKQVNVGLPEPLHSGIRELADNTHRSIVGTIAWLYAEQMKRESNAASQDSVKSEPVTTEAR